MGREDLAREALTRKSGLGQQLADLQTQHANLQAEEEKLTTASQRLQAKVEAFRTKKETIKATYTAAEAQTKIGEAFSGISEEMSDVGLAMQRAEDKTASLQARAGAIDELLASGALEDTTGTAKDDITAELERMSSGGEVELELARMKGELTGGRGPEGDRRPVGDRVGTGDRGEPRRSSGRGSSHDRADPGRGPVRRARRRPRRPQRPRHRARAGAARPTRRPASGPR